MKNSIALITGISRGLGEAMAIRYLDGGYRVVGIGRSSSRKLDEHSDYEFVQTDLSDPKLVETTLLPLFKSLSSGEPQSVHLIHNAAVASPARPLGQFEDAEMISALNLNLVSAVSLTNHFMGCFGKLKADRRIVHISSGAGFRAIPGSATYCVGKAGVEMLAKAIQADQEGSSDPVLGYALSPGIIETGMQQYLRSQPKDSFPSQELFEGMKPNLQTPEQTAIAIVDRFLLKDPQAPGSYRYFDGEISPIEA